MLKAILSWYHGGLQALKDEVAYPKLLKMAVLEKIGRLKYVKENAFEKEIRNVMDGMETEFAELRKGGDSHAERI